MPEGANSRLSGRATADGTATTAARFGAASRTLGITGLHCSPLAFAAHGVRADDVLHARALHLALRSGVNVIATDGRDGDGDGDGDGIGERLVGRVLAEAVAAEIVPRGGVIVLAGIDCRDAPSPALATARLEQTRARLALQHLDVAILQLDAPPTAALVDWLQDEVDRGTVGAWGLSCDGFAAESGTAGAVSAAAVLAGIDAHCRARHRPVALAMPLGPLQLGAALHREGAGPTSVEVAAAGGLAVLAHRSVRGDVPAPASPRLVEPHGDPPALAAALAQVRKLEAAWSVDLGLRLRTDAGDARDLFRWGQLLSQPGAHRTEAEQWQRLRHDVIAPHVGQTSKALLAHLQAGDRDTFARWWQAYGTALHAVFVHIEAGLGAVSPQRRIAVAMDPWLPPPWRELPLPCRAVGVALAAGATTVLVGMRTPARVSQLLAIGSAPLVGPIPVDALAVALAQGARTP